MTTSGDSSPTGPIAPRRKRFVLSGHSAPIDPLVDAVRDDLADVDLADRVFAPHYAGAALYRVVRAVIVLSCPGSDDPIGELGADQPVDVFDFNGDWAWIRAAHMVGYIPADAIVPA